MQEMAKKSTKRAVEDKTIPVKKGDVTIYPDFVKQDRPFIVPPKKEKK